MKHALFSLFALFAVSSASAEAPAVTFISPCECQGFHGKNRWVTKTDLSPVPLDKSAIQSVTPSQIYAWDGLGPDSPNSSSHDVNGENAVLMTREQIIDKIAND